MAETLTKGQRAYRARQERLREEGAQQERLRRREANVNERERRAAARQPSPAARTTNAASRVVQAPTKSGPNPDIAIVALTVAGGVIFYDLSQSATRSGKPLSDQQKLSAGLAFGVGSVILLALAEALPELGVPLSLLLLLTVLVGRPQALQFVSRIAANAGAANPPQALTPAQAKSAAATSSQGGVAHATQAGA